jgi:hypothetical protein
MTIKKTIQLSGKEFVYKMKEQENDIASQELNLNIINQDIQVKEFTQIGYEWDKGIFVFILMIPTKMLGFKIKANKINNN